MRLTVWQLHWLVQWLIVAQLKAGRPQQHDLIALLDERVHWRIDRAFPAASKIWQGFAADVCRAVMAGRPHLA
jgi:hypothetical protein